MRPLLLLEINEMPWRLVDLVSSTGDHPALAEIFSRSSCFRTMVEDDGELSPWVVWPSLHRGLSAEAHGIHFLGQDPRTFRGEPIWAALRRAGHSIGVFGSLQSWPPIEPGPGGFYVPDSFAYDDHCHPSRLEPLQAHFRSQISAGDASIMTSDGVAPRTARDLLLGLGLGEDLLWRAVEHDHPISATEIAWEAFKTLYNPDSPPLFSTFFTNHIAAILHRHWDVLFPQDFAEAAPPPDEAASRHVAHAIRTLEGIVDDGLRFAKRNPDLILVFATGTGQSALRSRSRTGCEIRVADLRSLLRQFGLLPEHYQAGLAMDPQAAVRVPEATARGRLMSTLNAATTASRQPLFRVTERGDSLRIHVRFPSVEDIDAGYFVAGPSRVPWNEAGLEPHRVKAGTAYHIPEGVLAVYDEKEQPAGPRAELAITDVKDLLRELVYSNP